MVDQNLIARLAISSAFEPGNETVGQLVAEHGAPELVERLSSAGQDARSSAMAVRWQSANWLEFAARELDRCAAEDVRLVVPGTREWPTQLDDLQDRVPLVLRVKGTLRLRDAASRSIAVVGARAATQYGVWVAEELCADLASAGWCVISGGALGIDAASHRGALAVHGRSIAVSAAGADLAVPASNHSVFARLFAEGAVVSEVPLGSHPNRRRFLVRNRVIAALAPVVVVVEAARRSGALSTAREGDAMGRILCAVPGPTTSALSSGCNYLIRSGAAKLVTCADDVVNDVIESSLDSGFARPEHIDLIEQRVIDLCAPRSLSTGGIAQEVKVSMEAALAILHLLERKGLVTRTTKGWRASNSAELTAPPSTGTL